MDKYEEDRLESVDLRPSRYSEVMLIQLGAVLYSSLVATERSDEVELLLDAVGEYTTMASFYGNKTERIPESLGVDLNEAALFKRDGSKEWRAYADQFKNNLDRLANKLDVKLPSLD